MRLSLIHKPIQLHQWWSLLAYRLLLVPEAVLLPLVLCLHAVYSATPLFGLLGLLISVVFLTRTALLVWGYQRYEQGRYHGAAWMVRWALRLYPCSADGVALAGLLRQARGDYAAAERDLRRAIELYPVYGRLYVLLNTLLEERDDLDGARRHALYALDLAPQSSLWQALEAALA